MTSSAPFLPAAPQEQGSRNPRFRAAIVFALGLWFCLAPRLGACAIDAESIARREQSSVVRISGYMGQQSREPYAQASAVLLGEGGQMVSVANLFTDRAMRHMCERYLVRFADGRERQAKAVSVDAMLNLMVLEIVEPGTYAVGKTAAASVSPGDAVIALAGASAGMAAFALGRIKTQQKRSVYGAGLGDMYIDSEIQLPEHAFGGALLDSKGMVVGINTPNVHRPDTQLATTGEAHAIPVGVAKGFLRIAKANPIEGHHWLGLAFRPLHSDDATAVSKLVGRRAGLRIDYVWADGPAAKTDIRSGEILVSLNGEALGHLHELEKAMRTLRPGEDAELALLRGNRLAFRRIGVQSRPPWAGYVPWRVPQSAEGLPP